MMGTLITPWPCPLEGQGPILWSPWCQCRGRMSMRHPSRSSGFCLLVFPAQGHVLENSSYCLCLTWRYAVRARGGVMQHCDCRAAAEWLIDESSLCSNFMDQEPTRLIYLSPQCSLSRPLELLPTSRANCRGIGPGIKHGPVLALMTTTKHRRQRGTNTIPQVCAPTHIHYPPVSSLRLLTGDPRPSLNYLVWN